MNEENSVIGIFLDDERSPEDVTWLEYPDDIEWCVVRRMNDFLFCVYEVGDLSDVVISFDHDIADFDLLVDEVTGYDCIKYLVNLLQDTGTTSVPTCYFHTQNPIGKENMQKYWENYLKFKGNSEWLK